MIPLKSMLLVTAMSITAVHASESVAQENQAKTPASLEPVDGDLYPEQSDQTPTSESIKVPALEEPDGELYPESDDEPGKGAGSVVQPPINNSPEQ